MRVAFELILNIVYSERTLFNWKDTFNFKTYIDVNMIIFVEDAQSSLICGRH